MFTHQQIHTQIYRYQETEETEKDPEKERQTLGKERQGDQGREWAFRDSPGQGAEDRDQGPKSQAKGTPESGAQRPHSQTYETPVPRRRAPVEPKDTPGEGVHASCPSPTGSLWSGPGLLGTTQQGSPGWG